jgi:hypothetical protein
LGGGDINFSTVVVFGVQKNDWLLKLKRERNKKNSQYGFSKFFRTVAYSKKIWMLFKLSCETVHSLVKGVSGMSASELVSQAASHHLKTRQRYKFLFFFLFFPFCDFPYPYVGSMH